MSHSTVIVYDYTIESTRFGVIFLVKSYCRSIFFGGERVRILPMVKSTGNVFDYSFSMVNRT